MDRCPHCGTFDAGLILRDHCRTCLREIEHDRPSSVPDPQPPGFDPEPQPARPAFLDRAPLRSPLQTSTAQLDPESLRYLSEIDRGNRGNRPGAFVRTSGPWFAGRRGGWRTLVFVGAVSL